MEITVIRLGEDEKVEAAVNGSTVSDVLAAANVSTSGMTFSRNGSQTTLGAEVRNGDVITITPKVVGGN